MESLVMSCIREWILWKASKYFKIFLCSAAHIISQDWGMPSLLKVFLKMRDTCVAYILACSHRKLYDLTMLFLIVILMALQPRWTTLSSSLSWNPPISHIDVACFEVLSQYALDMLKNLSIENSHYAEPDQSLNVINVKKYCCKILFYE